MRTAPFRHVHNTRANAASNMPASSHRHFGGWAKLNVVPHRLSELLTKITDLGSFPLQYRFIAHPSLLPWIIPHLSLYVSQWHSSRRSPTQDYDLPILYEGAENTGSVPNEFLIFSVLCCCPVP
jgi:hypothetical protein